MTRRLLPEEVIETWEECLLLTNTDQGLFEETVEVGAELVKVLTRLGTTSVVGVAALIVLAWQGAEVLAAEAKALNEELEGARRRDSGR